MTKKQLRAKLREARESRGRKIHISGFGNVWSDVIITSRRFGTRQTIYYTDSHLFAIPSRPEVTQFGGWELEQALDVITRKVRNHIQRQNFIYLAEVPDLDHPEYRKFISRTTSEGRVLSNRNTPEYAERWAEVRAADMAEARAKFAAGEVSWHA